MQSWLPLKNKQLTQVLHKSKINQSIGSINQSKHIYTACMSQMHQIHISQLKAQELGNHSTNGNSSSKKYNEWTHRISHKNKRPSHYVPNTYVCNRFLYNRTMFPELLPINLDTNVQRTAELLQSKLHCWCPNNNTTR